MPNNTLRYKLTVVVENYLNRDRFFKKSEKALQLARDFKTKMDDVSEENLLPSMYLACQSLGLLGKSQEFRGSVLDAIWSHLEAEDKDKSKQVVSAVGKKIASMCQTGYGAVPTKCDILIDKIQRMFSDELNEKVQSLSNPLELQPMQSPAVASSSNSKR